MEIAKNVTVLTKYCNTSLPIICHSPTLLLRFLLPKFPYLFLMLNSLNCKESISIIFKERIHEYHESSLSPSDFVDFAPKLLEKDSVSYQTV